jgi:hypothetical protein
MTAPITSQNRARLAILTPGIRAALAAEVVASHLGITKDEATARILRGPGILADQIDPDAARKLAVMLHLLGVKAQVEECAATTDHVARFDVALQVMSCGARPAVLAALATTLGRPPEEVALHLAAPAGLVQSGLDWDRISLWRRAMPRLAGLRMVISDPETARYDLIPVGPPADPAEPATLVRSLARLGLARCAVTGALACDLDRALCDHLLRRHRASGVAAINRDFQRFDLLLIGCDGLSLAEMADFLVTRTALPRAALVGSGPSAPLTIEQGLTRGQALSFHTEYAAIGLQTRLRMVGTAPTPQIGPAGLSP